MTTDDTVEAPTTDAWGRAVRDGMPEFGPPGGDRTAWPAVPMQVRTDEDVVTCAAGFARAFTSEYFFTIWLIALDRDGWTTKDCAELLDMPARPPTTGAYALLRNAARGLEELAPGCSVVIAIAQPAGGDRGQRDRAWSRALLQGAALTGLPVRGVVSVGTHRARLLHAGPVPGGMTAAAGPEEDGVRAARALPHGRVRSEHDLLDYAHRLRRTAQVPSFHVWLVPVDRDGEVCGQARAVEELPAEPEPVDRLGLADLLRDVADEGRALDPETELLVVLSRPAGRDVREEAWIDLVRDVAAQEGVMLRGVAAVGPAGASILDAGTLGR